MAGRRWSGQLTLDYELVAQLSHRMNKWRSEATDAESEMATAQAELAEVVARMIAE